MDKANFQDFHPMDFMRSRRPENFSDSYWENEPVISRDLLEYQLHTLTSRKQEYEFESFCRKLAEKELCPSLVPQTGPLGGGDSKVDAETYPVAEQISLRWYEGIPHDTTAVRWAFAFSAKEKWKTKADSDVTKIAKTNRGYSDVFFITNQFVKDKDRATTEETLSKTHGFKVHIFDRTWIVERIIKNKRFEIASEIFSDSSKFTIKNKVKGPRDTARQLELSELEKQIANTERYLGVPYQLVEDCLRAAILSRHLEQPRTEVDGRFDRAQRFAEKAGIRQQMLRIAYARAWTSFWWYEDFDTFDSYYTQVQNLCEGSDSSADFELLGNLYQLAHTITQKNDKQITCAEIEGRRTFLRFNLKRLAKDATRPTNALMAETGLALNDLILYAGNDEEVEKVLLRISKILDSISGMVNYPTESIIDLVGELGDMIGHIGVYDELFEKSVQIAKEHIGEAHTGNMFLEQGLKKAEQGLKYEALRLLGRAQTRLAKYEYWKELVICLATSSSIYESVGLIWTARNSMLAAANQALSTFNIEGKLHPIALTCIRRLFWLELQLGRIPQVLSWLEMSDILVNQLLAAGEKYEAYRKERKTLDIILGILILKADINQLEQLRQISVTLDKMGLQMSNMALKYALGHITEMQQEGYFQEMENSESIQDFFINWVTQPANEDIPRKPELLTDTTLVFSTKILGCTIEISFLNHPDMIYMAEAILGCIENVLATSLDNRLMSCMSKLRLFMDQLTPGIGLPSIRKDSDPVTGVISIACPAGFDLQTPESREEYHKRLSEIVLYIALSVVLVEDQKKYLKILAEKEEIFSRAFSFSDIDTYTKNILSQSPRITLNEWRSENGTSLPELRRIRGWQESISAEKLKSQEEKTRSYRKDKSQEIDFKDFNTYKHKDMQVLSVINVKLWERANWIGVLYLTSQDLSSPPIIALGFKNKDAGIAIFKEWHSEIGNVDSKEKIRFAIVTGIDRKRPSCYTIVIGMNPNSINLNQNSPFIMVSKPHKMEPNTTENLDRFRANYEKFKYFFLVPAHLPEIGVQPEIIYTLAIAKKEIFIRPAWELGEHDPDLSALNAECDPIIPPDIEDAPVLKSLERMKEFRAERRRRV